jgi:hypothetical protein
LEEALFTFNFRKLILGGVFAALAAVPASADAIYNFVGVCGDCYSGEGSVTATLDLSDSNTTISLTNFVSFSYGGSDMMSGYDVVAGDPGLSVSGSLVGLPGTANVEIDNVFTFFSSFSGGNRDGTWSTGNMGITGNVTTTDDQGTPHTWSAATNSSTAPEPATVGMIAGALAGIVFFRKRLLRALL